MKVKEKDLEYYKRLPYSLRMELITEEDKTTYWTAEYAELRGCKTDGETEADAVANLQGLFDEYIAAHLEMKSDIPEPAQLLEFGENDVLEVASIKATIQVKWLSMAKQKSKITDELRKAAEEITDTEEEVRYQEYRREKTETYVPA